MTKDKLDILLDKYSMGQCSPEEHLLVEDLLDRYVKSRITEWPSEIERTQILDHVEQQLMEEVSKSGPISRENALADDGPENMLPGGVKEVAVPDASFSIHGRSPVKKHSKHYRALLRYLGYAAAAIVCIGIGLYYSWPGYQGNTANDVTYIPKPTFVTPGTTSASLLLADGKKIPLDSVTASNISKIQIGANGVYLVGKNGQLTQLDKPAPLTAYSSLVTERGQQAPEMTLADGTKVWLNAASTLRFPARFSGTSREVQLTGEAYFEVARDATHPFIVHAGETDIRVLGTHFNVMAYREEESLRATLLEGSVELTSGQHRVFLSPGQQGIVGQKGNINVKKVEAGQSVAWLHGKLPMDKMEVHAFLREVSRWYDVDINYLDAIPSQTFSGNLNRQVPLENILAALKVNGVNARLENRTIIVSE